jgi:hypothetical protein
MIDHSLRPGGGCLKLQEFCVINQVKVVMLFAIALQLWMTTLSGRPATSQDLSDLWQVVRSLQQHETLCKQLAQSIAPNSERTNIASQQARNIMALSHVRFFLGRKLFFCRNRPPNDSRRPNFAFDLLQHTLPYSNSQPSSDSSASPPSFLAAAATSLTRALLMRGPTFSTALRSDSSWCSST